MAVSAGFQEFVLDQLSNVDQISARRMFGGVGIYSDGHFFALIDDDRLYFKVDDSNRPDFLVEEMGPFRPYGDERTMSYYQVPVSVLEDKDALALWAQKAITVSRSAKRQKKSRKPKKPSRPG